MANCRCGDISQWENKISVLTEAQGMFKSADHYLQSTLECATTLSGIYGNGFEADSIKELYTKTQTIGDGVAETRNSIATKIAARKGTLETELRNMRSEDAQYHEEERRRAQEEEERRAQEAMRQSMMLR